MTYNLGNTSLESFCRLCLSNDRNNVNIFGELGNRFNLQAKVWKHFTIWVRLEDHLPKGICQRCLSQVETFHLFTVKVEAVQQELQDILSSSQDPETYLRQFETIHGHYRDYDVRYQEACQSFERDTGGRPHLNCDQNSRHTSALNNAGRIINETIPVGLPSDQIKTPEFSHVDSSAKEEQSSKPSNIDTNCGVEIKIECEPILENVSEQESISSQDSEDSDEDSGDKPFNNPNQVRVERRVTRNSSKVRGERNRSRKYISKSDSGSDTGSSNSSGTGAGSVSCTNTLNDDYSRDKNSWSDSSEKVESEIDSTEINVKTEIDEELVEYPFKWSKNRPFTKKRLERSKRSRATKRQLADFYDYICVECDEKERMKFNSFMSLKTHFREIHNMQAYIICCKKKMTKRTILIHHMLTKHLQPEFRCQQCGKTVSSQKMLNYHIINHLPESERPFKCQQCGKGFSTKFRLSYHEKIHSTDEDRTYMCDACGKSFSREKQLYSHKIYHHAAIDKSVICHVCGKTFKNQSGLSKHMGSHKTGRSEKCPQCDKLLKSKETLYVHIRECHNGSQFQCPLCEKSYGSNGRLHSHIRTAHNESKPHQCNICSKTFKLKAGLKTHMVQHTGERPYQCPYCPRTFASGANYYTHKKRMHKEIHIPDN